MGCIRGCLVLPDALPGTSSRITVSLVDATHADAPAAVLAQTVLQVEALQSGPIIDFCLDDVPPRPPRRRWLFDATATADRGGQLRTGDYVLAHAVEYTGPPDSTLVRLRLKRIS